LIERWPVKFKAVAFYICLFKPAKMILTRILCQYNDQKEAVSKDFPQKDPLALWLKELQNIN